LQHLLLTDTYLKTYLFIFHGSYIIVEETDHGRLKQEASTQIRREFPSGETHRRGW